MRLLHMRVTPCVRPMRSEGGAAVLGRPRRPAAAPQLPAAPRGLGSGRSRLEEGAFYNISMLQAKLTSNICMT